MPSRALTAGLVAAVLNIGCANPAEPVLTGVRGLVTIDGVGAELIQVQLESGAYTLATVTGEDGAYNFTGRFAAGPHTLTIAGYPENVTFPSVTHRFNIQTQLQETLFDFAGTTQ